MNKRENPSFDSRLLGRWRSQPSVEGYSEDVTLDFLDDGSLTYTIHAKGKDEVMLLKFRTESGVIVSDQESEPREERTPYEFSEEGNLLLIHDGKLTSYRRLD
jgi:hypothetical protein